MNINELVKKELLKKVKVIRSSNAVIDAGNKKYMIVFRENMSPLSPKRMSGKDCSCNSICVVDAMREKGEDDWRIVPGFALHPEEKDPIAHVWVRKGMLHYDPTWSLPYFDWEFEDLVHYQLVQKLDAGPGQSEKDTLERIVKCGNDTLRQLKDFAAKWNLRLAG